MQITEATIGRTFVVRLEEGDPLPECIEAMARNNHIQSAVVFMIGGAREGTLVTGPRDSSSVKPEPMLRAFTEAHEMVGVGTLFPSRQGPELHLHAALGRDRSTLVGCTREGIRTYLVGEVIVMELLGANAARTLDAASGFHLLTMAAAGKGHP